MKRKWLFPVIGLIYCVLFVAAGCQKNAAPIEKPQPPQAAAPQTAAPASTAQPRIVFETAEHDFGKIPPSTNVACEFKFKNTGNAVLKIEDVHATCGCTVPAISKKEYEPGQSGTITIKYHSTNRPRLDTKHVYVQSNDPLNSKLALTIKAMIVSIVSVAPEKLNLSLRDKNAGCSDITLTSTDGNNFSIKKFESTNGCITADFDPNISAAQFLLHPKVDVEKFRQSFNLEGLVRIEMTHPRCPFVTVAFNAVSEFRAEPTTIAILRAEPNKPVSKQVAIRSNYNEPFELESVTSRLGYTKVIAQRKDPNNGYTLDLLITPPPPKGDNRIFSDTLIAKIKNGEAFKINCRGFYAREPAKPRVADANQVRK